MKKILVVSGVVFGLVFLVLAGLAVWVLTFDANENKEWIEAKFREQTGRELTLGGNISHTLYPWLGVTAETISIGNAEGFSSEPLLAANHVEFRIKLLPLLRSRYEIDTVKLDGVRINLEVLGNGANNWTFQTDTVTAAEPEASSGSPLFNNLIIGGVSITDTSLVYDDQFANTHYAISDLELSIGELVFGAPLDIRMSLDAASRTPELAAAVAMNGTVLYDMDQGRYDLNPLALTATLRGPTVPSVSAELTLNTALSVNLEEDTLTLNNLVLAALGTNITAQMEAARVQTATPALNATLEANGDDLAVLFRVLGQNDLATRISSLDSSFNVTANMDVDMESGTLNIPTLQASLLDATINGQLAASNINDSDRLQTSGELTAAGPDLPLLLQITGQLLGGRESPLYVYGDKLRLGVRDRAFTFNTGFNADLARGNIELPALTAELLGFTVNANLNARDMQGSNGIISGSLQLSGTNLGEVLTALDQPELGEVAQSMTLDVQAGGSSSNLRLSPVRANLVVSGRQIPNSPQTLSLDADTVLNLDEYSLQADAFSLSGLGLNLNGSVSASKLDSAPIFSGDLSVPAFNARRFLEQLNTPLPPMSDDTVLQNVALTSAFGGTESSINLNNLVLTVDDSNITGSIAISDLATLATQFTVNIDQLNADRYMAPATTEPASTSAEASPLPVDELQTLKVEGTLTVGQLTVNRLNMRNIEIKMNAADGNLVLQPFRAALYDGTFDGDIRLNVNGAAPSASVTTTLSLVNLEPLLQDFMDSTYVTGIGNIKLSLTGSGADTAAIKRNLNGDGTVQLQDGVLSGVDVAAVLTTIETMIRSRRVQTLPQGGSTAFEESAATLAIRNGVVATDNLSVKAPGWKLSGTGTLVDLTNDTINFNLLVSVDESTVTSQESEYDLGGYTLPVACTGAINSPRCLPDARQIITAAVGNAVQQRLGNFLQDRLGGGTQAESTEPADSTAQELSEPEAEPEEEEDLEDQLINRALNRFLRN